MAKFLPDPVQVMYELTFGVKMAPDPETGLYESICFELHTASCGKTIQEAMRNIDEACDLELGVFSTSTELVKYLRSYNVCVFTDGDALRERDRIFPRDIEPGTLTAAPTVFRRELAKV